MTTDQYASNHPNPIGNDRYKQRTDEGADDRGGQDRSRSSNSPDDPHISVEKVTPQRGRSPERSDENLSRYRR